MENIILLIFAAMILACVFTGKPVLIGLLAGLVLFCAYALRKGFTLRETGKMCLSGILTAKNVLITFCIIGFLTGIWRIGGTVPAIVCRASHLIRPSVIVPLTFLLNCGLSFLIGTSFGTSATMGLICATIAGSMGVNRALIGGAVLSGVYFGDRCSPVSTSALLTAEVTGTNLYRNIRNMVKISVIPFIASTALYALLGLRTSPAAAGPDVEAMFSRTFDISWPMLLPAAVILILAAFRVPVKRTLIASVAMSFLCCLAFQHLTVGAIVHAMIFGYHTDDPEISSMLSGGGLVSMFRNGSIVLVASCYSGIFRKTGLLRNLQDTLQKIADRHFPFLGILAGALLSSVIACNQTLAIMMTGELCENFSGNPEEFALAIEDSAVLFPAVIPWSIACAAPLDFIGSPDSSVFFAFYLIFLPLWHLLKEFLASRKAAKKAAGNR